MSIRPLTTHDDGANVRRWALSAGLTAVLLALVMRDNVAAGEPFRDLRDHAAAYAGPGRDLPEPTNIQEVLIGYFGPDDRTHLAGGDLWAASLLAIDEANQEGGYQGKPFRLVARWSDNPWKSGAQHVTRLIYVDEVWALIGGIDGATTHLAEQVVAKARLPLLSAGSTDRTANLANVPWMFSCLPGDQLQAPVLAERVAVTVGKQSLVEITTDDHDSRQFAAELIRALKQQHVSPQYHYTCGAAADDVSEVIGRTIQAAAAAVLCVADAHDSAKLLIQLREAGYRGPVFGGPAMGRRHFLQAAGGAAEGVVFPWLLEQAANSQPFRQAFLSKCGKEPDFAATCSYDAVKLLVAAIRKAGLNRARIGDAIRELAPWPGAAGTIQWDNLGSNRRSVRLGTIQAGRIVRDS